MTIISVIKTVINMKFINNYLLLQVHKYVGHEPSGQAFNYLHLNNNG